MTSNNKITTNLKFTLIHLYIKVLLKRNISSSLATNPVNKPTDISKTKDALQCNGQILLPIINALQGFKMQATVY